MPTDKEMRHGLQFNKSRAATYQAIADKGGDDNWTQAAAQTEANKFQGWADRIAARISEGAGE